jgi:hypothetical protein
MNQTLWQKVEAFAMESSFSEYGMTLRLAQENFWTEDFTEKAILEYKKFMYLAAVTDAMVSPSYIVDIVWHTHLIFTQSYTAFCDVLGKRIEHIPSTHKREEFDRFQQAKTRTQKLYKEHFGPQPEIFWEYDTIHKPLLLDKSKFKLKSVLIGLLATFPLMLIVFPWVLKDLFIQIDNPFFLFLYGLMILLTAVLLAFYNQSKVKQLINSWSPQTFLFHLKPSEVLYLKRSKIDYLVHDKVNALVQNKQIDISYDDKLSWVQDAPITDMKSYVIRTQMSDQEQMHYNQLLHKVISKPAFQNTAIALDEVNKYFSKSAFYSRMYLLNFGFWMLVLLWGISRWIVGSMRDKPVNYIVMMVLFLSVYIWYRLASLKYLLNDQMLQRYEKEIIPQKAQQDPEWNYVSLGQKALVASFVPIVLYANKQNKTNTDSSGSCGTSDGGSCGSSCGSSCGGCGGD